MTEDEKERAALGAQFSVSYLGSAMCDAIEEVQAKINDRLELIKKYLPYLSGMYYSDRQRRMAEVAIFRLQHELNTLHQELVNTLVMAPDIGHLVTINN